MNEWAAWEVGKRLGVAAEALEKNGFRVARCADRESAVARVLEEVGEARTVGFGGSVTLVELGLPQRLAELGRECLIHGAPGLKPEERVAVMRRQLTCDVFLTGANAVTLDGKLVNIDATGNRVAAMTFGPGKVVAVAGANKLADDVHQAVARVRAWASPPNARRLSFQTPCAETGLCSDCRSPDRICRVVHIQERRPRLTDTVVVLVAEALGL
ncbi:MAG: lactate utilization protein [Deferrisomatales bacterium]|nr:lactate utilization protein [Deferrisomatales bacterium]